MLKVAFGNIAMNRVKEEYNRSGKKVRLDSFILDLWVEELRNLDYSEDSIGRMIFECALDHSSVIVAEMVNKKLKIHKVPKFIPLPINTDIPKVE